MLSAGWRLTWSTMDAGVVGDGDGEVDGLKRGELAGLQGELEGEPGPVCSGSGYRGGGEDLFGMSVATKRRGGRCRCRDVFDPKRAEVVELARGGR